LVRIFELSKKAHDAQVLHQAGVVFGEQHNVERPAATADMVEADLIAEDGLAAAGWSLNDVEATLRKPPFRITSKPEMPLGNRSRTAS
jgi:hypothetical protein